MRNRRQKRASWQKQIQKLVDTQREREKRQRKNSAFQKSREFSNDHPDKFVREIRGRIPPLSSSCSQRSYSTLDDSSSCNMRSSSMAQTEEDSHRPKTALASLPRPAVNTFSVSSQSHPRRSLLNFSTSNSSGSRNVRQSLEGQDAAVALSLRRIRDEYLRKLMSCDSLAESRDWDELEQMKQHRENISTSGVLIVNRVIFFYGIFHAILF